MAASFVSASSQILFNGSVTTLAMPFTVGCWVYSADAAGSTQTVWSIADTAVTNHYWRLTRSSAAPPVFQIGAASGSTANTTSLGTAFAVGTWNFVVVRMISATNRWISAWQSDGLMQHAQGTTSRSPTGIDTISVGARKISSTDTYWGGSIAEFWYTDTDIQADGAQLENALLWRLAFCGPFSVPHVAKALVEYRSFRTGLADTEDLPEEIYYRGLRPTWTNTNVATLGPHPPLPGRYINAGEVTRPAVV